MQFSMGKGVQKAHTIPSIKPWYNPMMSKVASFKCHKQIMKNNIISLYRKCKLVAARQTQEKKMEFSYLSDTSTAKSIDPERL